MKEVTMTGLTNEQVQQRIEEGKINVNENPNTRSYKQIVRENVLTFFNFLNLALMIMVLLVGSYKNSMFMGIIVINTVIGIIQEVRAKKTLDNNGKAHGFGSAGYRGQHKQCQAEKTEQDSQYKMLFFHLIFACAADSRSRYSSIS